MAADAVTAKAVAVAAHADDPSIELAVAEQLATACLAALSAEPSARPPELARACLRVYPDADVSWVNHVARCAALIAERRASPE